MEKTTTLWYFWQIRQKTLEKIYGKVVVVIGEEKRKKNVYTKCSVFATRCHRY